MATASAAPAAASRVAEAVFSPRRRLLAGILLAMSNFMVVLDLTIANVSVPHIAGNLGITLEQGTWIISSYAVAEAVCVPLTGWIAQRYGVVRVFIVSMIGFGFFSLLCGLSMSLGMLVVCRIGQGLFGGPMMPMSQTLMLRVFPPEQRTMAMGVWAMTVTLGPAFGPILGGWISDEFSWHWIFLINVPIAVICIVGAWLLLRPVETEAVRLPIDRIGLALLVFWIGCLQIMLDTGREHDWFADPWILGLGIFAAIGLIVFVIWELTEKHPIVDLWVFRHIGFTVAAVTMAVCFAAFFAGMVVVPQFLQSTLGYTATEAGLITATQALGAVITSPIAAKLAMKYDSRLLVSGGVFWMGAMAGIRAFWTSSADWETIAWPLFLQGLAMPFLMIPLTTLALGSVEHDETATAAGMQNFMRTMGIAVATAGVLTVWGNLTRVARSELVGHLNPGELETAIAGRGFTEDGTRQLIASLVEKEAVTMALNNTFLWTAVAMFIASALVWIAPKTENPVDGPMGH